MSLTLSNIEDDFALIALIVGTADLVFVDQALALYANALNNRKLVPFMIPQRLLD